MPPCLSICSELATVDSRKVVGDQSMQARQIASRQAKKEQLQADIQLLADNLNHWRSLAGAR
jgi:hypothetical protein